MKKCPTVPQTVPSGVPSWCVAGRLLSHRPTYKEWWDVGQTVVKGALCGLRTLAGTGGDQRKAGKSPSLAHAEPGQGEPSRKGRYHAGKPGAGRSGGSPGRTAS